jgi:hypothetical protein
MGRIVELANLDKDKVKNFISDAITMSSGIDSTVGIQWQ